MADPVAPSTSGGAPDHVATNHSSPIKESAAAINPHVREEWSNFIYPTKDTEIPTEEMVKKLCPNHYSQAAWSRRSRNIPKTPAKLKAAELVAYLNQISRPLATHSSYSNLIIGRTYSFETNLDYSILFEVGGGKPIPGHPTGTACHPDIVAYQQHVPAKSAKTNLHWSHLEATGEVYSLKKTLEHSEAQAAGYTSYHLQARPDRRSVSGIWTKDKVFRIFFTDACQVFRTREINIREDSAGQLFFAFVWSLYHPQLDRSITRNLDVVPPTFKVQVGPKEFYNSLTVSFAGEAVGRRTTIMTQEHNCDLVIKEQYIEEGRRFDEGGILDKLHKDGIFPGVVRVGTYGPVKSRKVPIAEAHTVAIGHNRHRRITRHKRRLVLKDKGTPLAKVKTIKKFLMGLYDLLEIIRNADKHRGILHRDISPGNILVRDEPRSDGKPLATDLGDMCFSSYLLKKPNDQVNKPSLEERLDSDILVTDFDSAEDKDPSHPNISRVRKARTGTPTFMARVVRNVAYPAAVGYLPPAPDIHPQILPHYRELFPDRIEDFRGQLDEEELVGLRESVKVPPTEFRHEQRYDAESVFWYLLWWSLLAQPAEGYPVELIPSSTWSNLTGPEDDRHEIFVVSNKNFRLHSAYSKLAELLNSMRQHLLVDSQFTKDPIKKRPDYLTEVFQRLILNFLVENEDQPFMVLEKSDKDRKVPQPPSGGATTSKSIRSTTSRSTYLSTNVNSVGHSIMDVSLANESQPPGSSFTTHSSVDRSSPILPIETRSSKRILANQARSTLNTSNTSAGTKRSFQEVDKDPDPAQSESPPVRHKKQRPLDPPMKSNSGKNQPETPPTPRRSTRRRRSDE
ncbi:hypothetical protein FRC19_002805 [Serendipita sp. 401]|nr:hypothetical protein FRC19_002805 [Serendipita sp. 401]KAG9043663.1 hypothetical protein FS842_001738 [Serendipita sp. 407]